ncbi:hypothetical protein bcgnr5405_56020 [Bacillus cereus]
METTNSKPYVNTNEGVFTSIKLQEAIDQAFRIPVFLSTVNTLNQLQQQFLDRLILEIEQALLFPRTIPRSDQYPESPLTSIRRMILSSYGLIAINFQRFFVQGIKTNVGPFQPTEPFWEGTPFSQIEPAMGYQYGLPLLLIRETGTDNIKPFINRPSTPVNNPPITKRKIQVVLELIFSNCLLIVKTSFSVINILDSKFLISRCISF